MLATAKRLGYPGPDPVARSLRTRRAGAVGLMITEPLTYSFSDPAAPDSLTVVESHEHTAASGGVAAEVALQDNPRITALMCTVDVLALSTMDYSRAQGNTRPGR